MNDNIFKAERDSRTEAIALDGSVEEVFPLFGAIEEKKWADGWNPVVLYPHTGTIEERMVFTTQAHSHHESLYAWMVSKFQPENHIVEYIVSTENRCWVINIRCDNLPGNKTKAAVTYTFTGLNALGNEINKHALEQMFRNNLEDWAEAINHYLKTGETLKHRCS